MSTTHLESWTRQSMSKTLARTITQYLRDGEHRREFEEWYEQTYGKKYIWKERK